MMKTLKQSITSEDGYKLNPGDACWYLNLDTAHGAAFSSYYGTRYRCFKYLKNAKAALKENKRKIKIATKQIQSGIEKIKILISMDGGVIQGISVSDANVDIVVVDYDCNAWTEDVKDPKNYDKDFEEGMDEVYGTASVARWENNPVIKTKMWKNIENRVKVNKEHERSSDIQERYVRDKLKEMNF